MKKYKFVKITDNNDHRQFWIDFTSMNDYRVRVSILWSKYLDYLENHNRHRPVYDILDSDWSACCIFRGSFNDLSEVRIKQNELMDHYAAKLKDYQPRVTSGIVSFF